MNEHAICECDFVYWATRYAFIIDIAGQLIRFSPNLPQQIILDIFSQMEEEGIAMLVQVLKARQEGVTTLSELIMLWSTMFYPQTNTLVASSRPDKSENMARMMEICYAQQPSWLRPEVESYSRGELIGFDKQNSYITIRHGAMMSGMGRGGTATKFHLSEVAEFLNPDEAIDAALLRAAHDNPFLIGILESTGAGRHGWWYDKWKYNVQYWPLRQSRLCPIFLPWYILRNLYPTPTWIKARPIPSGWVPSDLTTAHARRAMEYVQSGQNQVITKTLGGAWEMPPEQMWFWEVTRNEYAASKKLHLFYQELCADDREAFQSANHSVFDAELVFELHERTPKPEGVYGILAPQTEIPVQLQAREIDRDPNSAHYDIKCSWGPGQPTHEYRLIPLLHRGSAPFDPSGKIIMYEGPEDGEIYGMGTDTGFGVGGDNSVLEIVRKGSLERPAAQVLEYACADVNSFNLWPINLALGTLYSTIVNGQRRQCRQVIEGAANGEVVYNELKKRGWREFHPWVRYDRKSNPDAKANRQLWYTTSWSRPLLMDMFINAVNDGWLQINSPWLIEEMSDLELVWERMKIMAAQGKKDDRIMALGMVLISLHAKETRYADRWTARERRNGNVPMQFAKYSPGTQGNSNTEFRPDSTTSYTYQVVNPGDPESELLLAVSKINSGRVK